jgi:hypothetical protein
LRDERVTAIAAGRHQHQHAGRIRTTLRVDVSPENIVTSDGDQE